MGDEPRRDDKMDMSTIDEIDQEIFDTWPESSDSEDQDIPRPDRIGIDSALQDDEKLRAEVVKVDKSKHKGRAERELELRLLKPDSIRRQILERSLTSKNDTTVTSTRSSHEHPSESNSRQSHVMNIIEKAGMSGIDKERINQIIHEASKGSQFYQKQAQRQARIHRDIESRLNLVKSAPAARLEAAKTSCDKMLEVLEKQRVFNKIIVHFDLDMFFAAVEIRDNPSLKDKPVAVGSDSMVSTSNYVARRFGVRAAMPGFIARKLCPELILVRPNGSKYRQASSEVFAILERYDPELKNMSLDEAYLDLTEYVRSALEQDGMESQEYYDGTLPKDYWARANEIVEEIRQTIFDKTQLTCSAGIACNSLIAKISTDVNKPDGQFMVQGYPADVSDFISKTKVEKVSGIGKVAVQFLNAIDIKTCGDIIAKRHLLPIVYGDDSDHVRFYLRVALGDGSTSLESDDQRKSKSVERTFQAVKDTPVLLDKLNDICDELCDKYLKPYKIQGKTVTVKLKRNTFTTTTRSFSMLMPTNNKRVIYSIAKKLLLSEIANEPPEISYRLLGVKVSNLADDGVTSHQLTIDAMLKNQMQSSETKSDRTVHRVDTGLQEEPPPVTAIADDKLVDSANDNSESSLDKPQQGTSSAGTSIKSFFHKRLRSPQDSDSRAANDISFDSSEGERNPDVNQSGEKPSANTSQGVKLDDVPQDRNVEEDFQCPFCFRPVSDFIALETHVENCRFKTSIDVNKSFFSQRSQVVKPPAVPTKTQSETPKPKQTRKKMKRSQLREMLNVSASLPSTSAGRVISSCENSPKPTFYQQFIESNSQSLSQAQKSEPLRCPYCCHGFLHFPSLETHVMICTKRRSK